MNSRHPSDESLCALVDGEAGVEERERLYAAARTDAELARRIADLRALKALVQHGYEVAAPARAPPPNRQPSRHAAALAAVLAAFVIGWFASAWHDRAPDTATPTSATAIPGLVIQLADGDPVKWRLAIEQAQALRRQVNDPAFDVVVVAYGPGLGMLVRDSSVRQGIGESLAGGVRYLACGNTMARENVSSDRLIEGVAIAKPGALFEIARLEHAGYGYIRI